MTWLAAAAAAMAMALAVRAPIPSAVTGYGVGDLSPLAAGRGGPVFGTLGVWTVPLLGAGVCLAVLQGRRLVLALVALFVVLAVLRLLAQQRARVSADRRGQQVLAVCDGIAADLGAGQPPEAALVRAAAEWADFGSVASAARLGADVPGAMRVLATKPGASQLVVLAAAWQVAHRSGSGLAAATSQAGDNIRAQRGSARLVRAELASAQATARMLAVLPLGVLALGSGLGGDPVGFLVESPVGLGCLATGLLLTLLGLFWLQRIADEVTA